MTDAVMFELETAEGDILSFPSEEERLDYVLSRMIEHGQITPTGRNKTGDLIVAALNPKPASDRDG